MFDLDLIEEDWKNNSFRLSEEDIIEICRSENVTKNKYWEAIKDYEQKTKYKSSLTSTEKFMAHYLGNEEILAKENYEYHLWLRTISENVYPKKAHLSKEAQKKIVEGSLWIVFEETRSWYSYFSGKLSIEQTYYICLETLMNCTKYLVHCEKPVFELYVLKSIERSIIKYVARKSNITYREAYKIIHSKYKRSLTKEEMASLLNKAHFENKEEVTKPSEIFYHLKNEAYYTDYIKNISSNEFLEDYKNALNTLDETERKIMKLSFDNNGFHGLTNAEIEEYLGINQRKVSYIRKKAIINLRKDKNINIYLH